jgi:hypothetical protein
MPISPSETILTTVEELEEFSASANYIDTDTLLPAEILSVEPSQIDPGIEIIVSGSNVTIQGNYAQVFTDKTFQYIPIDDETRLVTSSLTEVPENIFALIKYSPDTKLSKLITYSVISESGNATISQTVTNNWDSGKSQMLNILSRGVN